MAKSNSNSGGRYPRQIKLADGRQISMRLMRPQDADEIVRFARTLPEEDLLFLRSDITDPAIVADWARNLERGATVTILAEIDEKLAGYASIHLSETRWTRGVG